MSSDEILHNYLKSFAKLRRDYKNGGAPHKPVLLLSIIQLIRRKEISSNRIEITPELLLEFKSIWSQFVTGSHIANFSLPFFHMRSEPFWELVCKPGFSLPLTSSHSIKSLSTLRECLQYAQIDTDLFKLMQEPQTSLILEKALLQQYFPDTQQNVQAESYWFREVEQQILNEDQIQYVARINELQHELPKNLFEEEIFARGGVFKREIPKIYGYQCAISGMRVEAAEINVQLIDACHIVPFALSKNDTITNGISLCPNLHRAFDRGLITLNDDYSVVVSSKIKEYESPYSLMQFHRKSIHLPQNNRFYPAPENLNWHRRERFVG